VRAEGNQTIPNSLISVRAVSDSISDGLTMNLRGPDARRGCALEFWDTSMGELREIECHTIEKRHPNADRTKSNLWLLELPRVLVSFNHVARFVINANERTKAQAICANCWPASNDLPRCHWRFLVALQFL
jgi:hypothetical protein